MPSFWDNTNWHTSTRPCFGQARGPVPAMNCYRSCTLPEGLNFDAETRPAMNCYRSCTPLRVVENEEK